MRGKLNKELTEDGRENFKKRMQRDLGCREETKTKKKRKKKSQERISLKKDF